MAFVPTHAARSARHSWTHLRSHGTKALLNRFVPQTLGSGQTSADRLIATHKIHRLNLPSPLGFHAPVRLLSSSSKQSKQRGFVPRKAALNLTPTARKFCKLLLKNAPEGVTGIMLKYQMSSAGDMRMVFLLDFARADNIGPEDEGVSLEVLEDGAPKPPSESDSDGLPKLYIHHTAFMKVLGGTMDIEIQKDGSFEPTFKDREGNELDPNN